MIALPSVLLPQSTLNSLQRFQLAIDQVAGYAERVDLARREFARRNRSNNNTFRVIRQRLSDLCSGVVRCGYCEDSCADEVEHIRPKDLYPEATFLWENYLFACGRCNMTKNNRFAVFAVATGLLTDVTRRRGQPIVPPELGDPVLLNPRADSPFDFIELDLVETFYFLPARHIGARGRQRAAYTIEVLRLNDRDELPRARKVAYNSYRACLREYVAEKESGDSEDRLANLVDTIRRMGHPTVWHEMKRQHALIPELSLLFDRAPEAFDW